MDRCGGQHHHRVREIRKDPPGGVRSRRSVPHVVCFIDDHKIELVRQIFEIGQCSLNRILTNGVQTTYCGTLEPAALTSKVIQQGSEALRVVNLRFSIESEFELLFPLFAQHRRAHDDQPRRVRSRLRLQPNKPGFDRFSQSDFVGYQNAAVERLDVFVDRLELVRVKIRPARLHCVENVR